MSQSAKRILNEMARQYIRRHPDCTYEKLVHAIGHPELSKAYFFNMRGQVRKSGGLDSQSKAAAKKPPTSKMSDPQESLSLPKAIMTVDILESLEISGLSDELRRHYQTHVLPLLKRHVPGGPSLQMVFLSDPPKLEIRRLVS